MFLEQENLSNKCWRCSWSGKTFPANVGDVLGAEKPFQQMLEMFLEQENLSNKCWRCSWSRKTFPAFADKKNKRKKLGEKASRKITGNKPYLNMTNYAKKKILHASLTRDCQQWPPTHSRWVPMPVSRS
jgi:hypothetical protein